MAKKRVQIGIIGGTGFYDFFKKDAEKLEIKTEFGAPSDKITIGKLDGKKIAFLPRHGHEHKLPPHKIPYRANVAALKKIGVKRIIAPCSVGSLKQSIKPGHFVVCDQFVDRTKKRQDTFFDGPRVAHIEAAFPYCSELRKITVRIGKEMNFKIHSEGTAVVIEGPRFSTVAESVWYSKRGWDVVNMTQYPEVILALEMGMCYLNLSLVTDYDVGIYSQTDVEPVSIEQVVNNFQKNTKKLKKLIGGIIKEVPTSRGCECSKKSERAFL